MDQVGESQSANHGPPATPSPLHRSKRTTSPASMSLSRRFQAGDSGEFDSESASPSRLFSHPGPATLGRPLASSRREGGNFSPAPRGISGSQCSLRLSMSISCTPVGRLRLGNAWGLPRTEPPPARPSYRRRRAAAAAGSSEAVGSPAIGRRRRRWVVRGACRRIDDAPDGTKLVWFVRNHTIHRVIGVIV